MNGERKKYLVDQDLSVIDRALYQLLDESAAPIPWQSSDDTILAFAHAKERAAATINAGGAPAGESRSTPDTNDGSVIALAGRRSLARARFLARPLGGLAIAASLMLGVFAGQALIPYLNFGLAPPYETLMAENQRMSREESITRSIRAKHEEGDNSLPLGNLVSGFPCSNLTITLSSNRELAVSGYVASREDFSRLQTSLLDLEDVASIKNNVSVYTWPSCEIIGVLQQATASGIAAHTTPIVQPFNHSGRYREGENLIIEAINRSSSEGYAYVDYIQQDGEVVHMLPSPGKPKNQMKAAERVMLGVGPVPYIIAPPFGTDMISIILSPVPLFDELREEVEPVQTYMSALRDALKRAGKGDERNRLLSSFTFIETSEGTPKAD